MNKFVLLFAASLTLSSCATEAETRAAMTGAVLGAAVGAVLVDQSSGSTRSTRKYSGNVEESHSNRREHAEYSDDYERDDD